MMVYLDGLHIYRANIDVEVYTMVYDPMPNILCQII